ncbi:MAG: recombinase family protein [Xenococcaceae cyanobacterium]
MRVAIYCRVSTLDRDCERQERDLLDYAQRAGYLVVGIWKETSSGIKLDLPERKQVMVIAQARQIDAVLVTELTRWGRSTLDLLHTLTMLKTWDVSLIAQTGLQFDLSTPMGRLIALFMSALAEFERDLLRERIRSGIAAAKARGVKSGRRIGQRVKADKVASRVLLMVEEGYSYRDIAKQLHISKNTVGDIVKRNRELTKTEPGC